VYKAVALEGWRLFHDPNISSLCQGGICAPVVGNPNRDLWKTVCWRLASDVGAVLPSAAQLFYFVFLGKDFFL
jgi:hypothetical protein